MKVVVKGKYDWKPYTVEILELGVKNFVHKAGFIISCHSYEDILKIIE